MDNILVMDNGRIAESGTYKQLLENGKAFADFIKKYKNDDYMSSDDEENVFDSGKVDLSTCCLCTYEYIYACT